MTTDRAQHLSFMKMHGLGNDFVVFDARDVDLEMTPALARALSDRHRGVGFDQLAVITPGQNLTLSFYNADGSTSGACGNATRCIAAHEMARTGAEKLAIDVTGRGRLSAARRSDDVTEVNMGAPGITWEQVPLSEEADTLHLPIDGNPVATSMGNPHCTFFVNNVDEVDLALRGAEIEHHPLFPERTNVQFVQIVAPDHLRMRVWERGTGITLASGSSSCAVTVAAHRRGLTGRKVRVDLDGGTLEINWRDDGVWMAGPTSHVFDGVLTPSFLANL